MSEAEFGELAKRASTGDLEARRQFFYAVGRTVGWTPEQVQRFGRLVELRQLQRTHGENHRIRALLRQLWNLRRTGFGGAAPPQFSDLSRPEFRRMWSALRQRGSAGRQELAQFIGIVRRDPYAANYVRQLIRTGTASGSLAFLGGHISGRGALMRAAFGAVARTTGAFLLTPQGLVVTMAVLLLVAGVSLYSLTRGSAEKQIASASARYLGCFFEKNPRALDGSYVQGDKQMTNATCRAFCKQSGFRYAGTEWGQECYCGNTLPDMLLPESACDHKCTGNELEICGGYLRLSIFEQ